MLLSTTQQEQAQRKVQVPADQIRGGKSRRKATQHLLHPCQHPQSSPTSKIRYEHACLLVFFGIDCKQMVCLSWRVELSDSEAVCS